MTKDWNENGKFDFEPRVKLTIERWPTIGFHATREHGERLTQADLR